MTRNKPKLIWPRWDKKRRATEPNYKNNGSKLPKQLPDQSIQARKKTTKRHEILQLLSN